MIQTDRYLRIQSIHSQLPWSDLAIISEANELAEGKFRGAAVDYLWRLRDRGASIATFEIYSPYWFLPEAVPEHARHLLSVASVVSAAAIIAIDNSIDDFDQPSTLDPIVFDQANYWGEVATNVLSIRTNWMRTIKRWCVPRHGISESIAPTEIPLRKNPFYRQAATTYAKGCLFPADAIARLYTKSLGTVDDILDLVDDFVGKRPNVVLSALKLPKGAGLDELLYGVIRGDLLRRYCRSSIRYIHRAKLLADASGRNLLARTCEVYEEKFAGLLAHVNAIFVAECAERMRFRVGGSENRGSSLPPWAGRLKR